MATIATLIERLGKPPRAVCLDWAWQISQMPIPNESSQANASEREPRKETIDHSEFWELFKVDSKGVLSPCDPGAFPDTIRPHCVQQLLSWAEQPALPTVLNRELDDINRPASFASSPRLSEFNEQESEESAYNTPAPHQLIQEQESATPLDEFSRRPVIRQRKVGSFTNRSFWYGSISLGCAMVAAIYWGITSPNSSSSHSTKNLADALGLTASTPASPDIESQTVTQSPNDTITAERITSQTATPQPASSMDDSTTNSNDLELLQPDLNMFSSDVGLDQGTELLLPELPLSTSTFNDESKPPAEITAAHFAETQLPPSPHPQSLQDADLVKVVSDMTPDAPTAVADVQMTPSTASTSEQPLLIPIRAKPQTIRMNERLRQRPGKPVWKLQLLTDDGFTVTPAESQSIAERTPAIWRLTSSEARSPTTAILIKLELIGKSSDLKCTIAGAADDLPQLMMPIEANLLPNIQNRMALVATEAEKCIDAIKLSYASLPREHKPTASAQRKQLESQLRLARRLITIASELALMHDQLHGQISAVGKLSDGTSDNAAILFRFGTP